MIRQCSPRVVELASGERTAEEAGRAGKVIVAKRAERVIEIDTRARIPRQVFGVRGGWRCGALGLQRRESWAMEAAGAQLWRATCGRNEHKEW